MWLFTPIQNFDCKKVTIHTFFFKEVIICMNDTRKISCRRENFCIILLTMVNPTGLHILLGSYVQTYEDDTQTSPVEKHSEKTKCVGSLDLLQVERKMLLVHE